MKETTRGHLAALFCMIVWALTFVSTKVLLRSFTAGEVTVLRSAIAYVTLIILSPKPVRTASFGEELPYILGGAFGVAGYFILQNVGLAYTTATNSSIILNTAPLFIVLLTWLVLKDKSGIHVFFFIGFIMAITGISLMTVGGGGDALSIGGGGHLFGDALTVGAALMWGLYTIAVQRVNSGDIPVLRTTRRICFWGLVCLIPFVAITGFKPSPAALVQPVNLINLLFLGVFASAFCFITWNYAVRALGPVKSSIYIYGQPLVSVVASFFVLNEKMTAQIAAGIALTFAGVLISGRRPRRA